MKKSQFLNIQCGMGIIMLLLIHPQWDFIPTEFRKSFWEIWPIVIAIGILINGIRGAFASMDED